MNFPVGEFVKNKIHGYTSFLIGNVDSLFGRLILKDPEDARTIWLPKVLVGIFRTEVLLELEILPATNELIALAKEELPKCIVTNQKILDNLTYIELLNTLNDKEKALKNENKI